MAYEIRAIEPAVVDQLRRVDDAGREPRQVADTEGGSPLRCCLRRSEPGEDTLLVSYSPLRRWMAETGADPGPYEELGPVFIHAGPCAGPRPGYPEAMGGPRRVFRAYRADGSILGGHLLEEHRSTDPAMASALLESLLDNPEVALIHVRAVEFGCFLFEARRPAPTP
ncbi:DUF1203 domain-containing protein [Sphaerimonospora thailandensis]|uniref:DUF1203 domain-containing protein n=1 Tax=Sphaerimonospora thailandensis TaxID=795644 RepID=A0A8J3R6W2_9ACTN|nr:DUF1203 domain-containing protein [Sphaerimonospora thailandensis]GIH68559.1 hypothetical protein Mth01_08120 [Sphaerimonospora thailandensis]